MNSRKRSQGTQKDSEKNQPRMDADLRGLDFGLRSWRWPMEAILSLTVSFALLVGIRNSELLYLIRVYLRSSAVLCFWVLCFFFAAISTFCLNPLRLWVRFILCSLTWSGLALKTALGYPQPLCC